MKLTKQQAFDKALFGIHGQNYNASADEFGSCFYRGPNDTMCAAGHCIPDELYDTEMEGRTFYAVIRDFDGIAELFEDSPDIQEFMKQLQGCHDYTLREHGGFGWENKMREIAKYYNLSYSQPAVMPENLGFKG
jgi:hypothetical protein